jgi:hypothetical protein
MRICCSLFVALSLAETLTMPLASMSKVTSICGMPRGAAGNAHQVELAEHLVVGGHFTLALEDADGHGRLVVVSGREHLALLGRDRGVAVDQAGEHAAQRFDAERQRGHVEQQHVLHVALQHAALDGGADGHDFVRVHALVGSLPKNCFTTSMTLGMRVMPPTRTTSSISPASARVLQGLAAGLDGLLDEVIDQGFELGARQLHGQMLRTGGIGRDEGQVDSVCIEDDSSILAFSAASFRRCRASLSLRRSMPCPS